MRREESEQQALDDAALDRVHKVREAIVAVIGPWRNRTRQGGRGTIPCPIPECGGAVHYIRTARNGRIRAGCTGNCHTAWIE